MNIQQLRYLRETVRRDLNLTAAAAALHTSQPGLSKAIRELESELGIEIFVRHGKRLTQLTDAGRKAIEIVERALIEIENLKRSAQDWHDAHAGELRIAATHTQARYTLPRAIATLRSAYPNVNIRLHQGSPTQVVTMLRGGQADIGIATEAVGDHPDLAAEDLFGWYHTAISLPGHPLASLPAVSLEELAQHDLVTYNPEFTGRSHIDRAFRSRALSPRIVLEATDSDVIKTYVRLGLGVGIISELALDDEAAPGQATGQSDRDLVVLPIGQPFARNRTRVAYLRGRMLRRYEAAIIEVLKQSGPPQR